MITEDTVEAFFAEFTAKKNTDGTFPGRQITAFCKQEPAFVSFLSVALSTNIFPNPLSAALFALSCYKKLADSQAAADALKKDINGFTEEEGTREA